MILVSAPGLQRVIANLDALLSDWRALPADVRERIAAANPDLARWLGEAPPTPH